MEDAEAFEELFRGEAEAVLLFLTRRTWDAETALELTAETFALALGSWRRLAALTVEQRRAWLYTVASRQLSRFRRRARVERRALQRLGVQVGTVDHDDILLIERRAGLPELREKLGRELDRLTVNQREALKLRVIEERSYEDVASTMEVSQQTARALVSRALRRLSAAFSDERQSLDRPTATQGGTP